MSDLVVRETFRAEVERIAKTIGIQFHPTINNPNDSINDEQWCTTSFYSFNNELAGYGDCGVVERGACDINVYVRPGTGDVQAATFLKGFIDVFKTQKWCEGVNGVLVESIDPIADTFNGDTSRWYAMSVSLNYYYSGQ
ncbi:hypothetical protein [Vibrio breoganii]|uniref:hypothetical protein n=1 Tax=Vibrio breoganii TaxID=553239 RepID=UPI000C8298BC|nr:hypothetical protein [Vibrio breoganii]PMK30663.1 hypothetical protein BCU03_09615 [Vibrio breoganii]